jgi:hypothetical protein
MTTTISVLPEIVDLVIERGDDAPFTLTAFSPTGGPMNFAGCVVWWTLKDPNDVAIDDAEAVAQYVWRDGGQSSANIVIANLASGIVALNVPKALTLTLKTGGSDVYRHDLQIKDAGGRETTVVQGSLTVKRDVTISST